MQDDDITPTTSPSTDEAGHQLATVVAVVDALSGTLATLQERVTALETSRDGDAKQHTQPAAWVVFPAPDGAADHAGEDAPRAGLESFVAWYNITYVGVPGGACQAIPPCWQHHPGLAMEVATLAYSWRQANIGDTANVRDAQFWHQVSRPGFTARLSDWVHPHCLDGRHRDSGAPARPDRFADPATG